MDRLRIIIIAIFFGTVLHAQARSGDARFTFLNILKINEEAKIRAATKDVTSDASINNSYSSPFRSDKKSATASNLLKRAGGGSLAVKDRSTETSDDLQEGKSVVDSDRGLRNSISMEENGGRFRDGDSDYDGDVYDVSYEYEDEVENSDYEYGSENIEDGFDHDGRLLTSYVVSDNNKVQKEVMTTSTTHIESQHPVETTFTSSGMWHMIDKFASLGLSSKYESLRVSKHSRLFRKAFARATGMHGLLSGKGRIELSNGQDELLPKLGEDELESVRKRIEAIETARAAAARASLIVENSRKKGFWTRVARGRKIRREARRKRSRDRQEKQDNAREIEEEGSTSSETIDEKSKKLDQRTVEELRIQEIDRLITEGQETLTKLQCEKDKLQQRPNPLFNYSSESVKANSISREFNFPSDDIVEEYIRDLEFSSSLVFLNHTQLWSYVADDEDDDELIHDEFHTSSVKRGNQSNNAQNQVPGNWLLRKTLLGGGTTLGEKLGETVETAAYSAVCQSVMEVLARSISGIHGLNIMGHADIRLFLGSAPDLPPIGKFSNDDNYAMEAIQKALKRGAATRRAEGMSDVEFLQRAALVETLISHCQISAPLLKIFPIAWQRALLSNIISLITSIMSDFCSGIRIQMLGHYLSLSFNPITEADMIRNLNAGISHTPKKRATSGNFDDAVAATAKDIADSLTFLDKWHERLLGGDVLKIQIGTLIARVVLTLVEECLSGFAIDLWSNQGGGPIVYAELEYRQIHRNRNQTGFS